MLLDQFNIHYNLDGKMMGTEGTKCSDEIGATQARRYHNTSSAMWDQQFTCVRKE